MLGSHLVLVTHYTADLQLVSSKTTRIELVTLNITSISVVALNIWRMTNFLKVCDRFTLKVHNKPFVSKHSLLVVASEFPSPERA